MARWKAQKTVALLCGCAALACVFVQGCDDQAAPVPCGTVRVVAQVPGGSKAGIAGMRLKVRDPKTRQAETAPLEWACVAELSVPVGEREFVVSAVDGSGEELYWARQVAQVEQDEAAAVVFSTWQRRAQPAPVVLALLAIAVAVGLVIVTRLVGQDDVLLVVVADSRVLVLLCSLVLGLVVAGAGVSTIRGIEYLQARGAPGAWFFVAAVVAAMLAAFEMGIQVTRVPLVDAALVGGTMGAAAATACLGFPLLQADGFPWVMWLGMGACIALVIRLVLHEKL